MPLTEAIGRHGAAPNGAAPLRGGARSAEELAQLLTRDNGKALVQSRGEMSGSISEILCYAGLARHVRGHVLEPEPGVLTSMIREAAGVAGIIVPWNVPAVLLARAIAPALAVGCTVVVKPAAQKRIRHSAAWIAARPRRAVLSRYGHV